VSEAAVRALPLIQGRTAANRNPSYQGLRFEGTARVGADMRDLRAAAAGVSSRTGFVVIAFMPGPHPDEVAGDMAEI
jgi:hypothetical protein